MPYVAKMNAVGVSFKNEDGSDRQEILGRLYDEYWTEGLEDDIVLELRREPDNEFDSNAVALYVTEPEKCAGKVGFIARGQAEWLAPALDDGDLISVSLGSMGLSSNQKVAIEVRIELRHEDDPPEESSGKVLVEDEDGDFYELD